MEPRISIITLGVANLEKSKQFYCSLGFPLKEEEEGIAFFLTQGALLALYPKEKLAQDVRVSSEGSGFPGFTLAHNVESKEKVNEVLQEAEKVGAVIVKPGQDVFWGGYSGYFQDPDGYLWEVAWNPFFNL